MMEEKELVARSAAFEISKRIRPVPQSIRVHVSGNTIRSDQEVPLSLGHQGGNNLSVGQMKIRNVMVELEAEIVDSLERASERLRDIALESWGGKE